MSSDPETDPQTGNDQPSGHDRADERGGRERGGTEPGLDSGRSEHADPEHRDHEHGDHEHGDHEHSYEASIERQGPRVELHATVPADSVADHVDTVARALRQRARLPGFRRGKAPLGLIRQRFKEDIREHVLDHLIPDVVSRELYKHDLRPLHRPILDQVDFDPQRPLTFSVHFDVAPEIDIGGYKDLTATRHVEAITDDVIDRALGDLRERAAQLEPIAEDEGAAENDYVCVDIALLPRDGKGKKLAEENRWVQLGAETAIPGLNTQLEGLKPGARREFVTRLGDDYPNDLLAGKEVTCRVEVAEIKRRRLPAVDDELAKDLGFNDLEELRARVRDDLEEQVRERADREADRQLLDHILEANPVEAPQSLVEDRLDSMVRRAARDLAQQGVDPRHSIDWNRFRAENRPGAERAVKEEILLDRIADAEDIEVGDADVVERIELLKGDDDTPTGTLVQQMRKDGSFDEIRRMLARQQALDCVRAHATIETIEDSEPAASTPADV